MSRDRWLFAVQILLIFALNATSDSDWWMELLAGVAVCYIVDTVANTFWPAPKLPSSQGATP